MGRRRRRPPRKGKGVSLVGDTAEERKAYGIQRNIQRAVQRRTLRIDAEEAGREAEEEAVRNGATAEEAAKIGPKAFGKTECWKSRNLHLVYTGARFSGLQCAPQSLSKRKVELILTVRSRI